MAITQASRRPLSRSRLIRCGGMAAVTAIMPTTNTPIRRKGALRSSCAGERAPPPATGSVRGGAPRRHTACSGTHTSRCTAASTSSAVRQPQVAISQAETGMKTLLARPPRKVSVMIARRKSCG